MARTPRSTDFPVQVEGLGEFIFARRSLRDDIAISTEFSRLTDGIDSPNQWLVITAGSVAAIKVLLVKAPGGWDVEEVDPLDPDGYTTILRVHTALRVAEERFRGRELVPAPTGQGDGRDPGLLVPAALPAAAQSPEPG